MKIQYNGEVRDATPEEKAAVADRNAILSAQRAIPQTVTMRQARLALFNAGLLATVDAAVAQSGDAAKIEWEYATEVKRDWPLVVQLGTVLGLDLDALFTAAAVL